MESQGARKGEEAPELSAEDSKVLARAARVASPRDRIRAAFGRPQGIASEPREKLGQHAKLPNMLIEARPEKACSINDLK